MQKGAEGQSLTAEDQLFVLSQAALYLTATRGPASPETRICYERAESLCHSLNRPLLAYVALMGQWRHSVNTEKLTATMQIAKRVYALARTLATTLYFLGEFETARQNAMRGVQIWRLGGVRSPVEDVKIAAVRR